MDLLHSWVLVHSCRERLADAPATGASSRRRLRDDGFRGGFGTNWPWTTGFVLRRAWTSGGRARIAALYACAAASCVSKWPMWRVVPFASLYAAFHRRSRLSHDTPQNLDVVAVRSRAGSGATMAERSRGLRRRHFGLLKLIQKLRAL